MSTWKRPESVPIPTVWATFQGKIETNGTKRTYWIQDITDEYKNEVVKYMAEQFSTDEPLTKYSKSYEIASTVEILKKSWIDSLKANLGLLCLTKDDNGKPTIAGMNCTTLCTKYDKEEEEVDSKVLQTLSYVKKQVNAFEKLNITEYLDAMGLYVLHKYRGEGLGLHLIKARETLCRAVGLKASLTLFTSIISQKLAEKAGFKDLVVIDYADLEKANPQFSYPNIQEHTKSIRYMYILYE